MTDGVNTFKTPQGSVSATVQVWDPMIRIFHWGLVLSFTVAWLSAEESQPLHEVAGYVVAGLVGFRLLWGFIGSHYARFAQFLRGPSATLSYFGAVARGRESRHLGHNPAGAAMIVVMLVALSGTALTGWLMAAPERVALLPALPQIVAPAFADDDGSEAVGEAESESPLEEVHEVLANLLLVLVALHLGGVVLASIRHRENLARAMVTGTKRGPGPGDVA